MAQDRRAPLRPRANLVPRALPRWPPRLAPARSCKNCTPFLPRSPARRRTISRGCKCCEEPATGHAARGPFAPRRLPTALISKKISIIRPNFSGILQPTVNGIRAPSGDLPESHEAIRQRGDGSSSPGRIHGQTARKSYFPVWTVFRRQANSRSTPWDSRHFPICPLAGSIQLRSPMATPMFFARSIPPPTPAQSTDPKASRPWLPIPSGNLWNGCAGPALFRLPLRLNGPPRRVRLRSLCASAPHAAHGMDSANATASDTNMTAVASRTRHAGRNSARTANFANSARRPLSGRESRLAASRTSFSPRPSERRCPCA